DGEHLRLAIKLALRANTGRIAAVAIEGFNRVALDIVREVIADCVDPAPNISIGAPARIAVFAALSGGVASLPIEPEYVALGPVFDLSYLEWRTSPPSTQQLSATLLSPEADAAIQTQVASGTANLEEAVRLAQRFVAKRNPTVERSIVRA